MVSKLLGSKWEFYTYRFGGDMRAMIRFDLEAAKAIDRQKLNNGVRLILYLPTDQLYPNGTPKQSLFESLAGFENQLLDCLSRKKVKARLVGVMSYSGLREFVFQVAESSKFQRLLTSCIKRSPFRTETRLYSGWQFFDQKVKPSKKFWGQISDRHVMEQLIKAGSDPQKEHTLEHFMVGSPADLEKLAKVLQEKGLRDVSLKDDHLCVRYVCRLDLDEIFRLTAFLRSMSEEYGVLYDGWGAGVVR